MAQPSHETVPEDGGELRRLRDRVAGLEREAERLRGEAGRRAEEAAALARASRDLTLALDALPIGVWLADRAGRVLYDNPAARRIRGDDRNVAPHRPDGRDGRRPDRAARSDPLDRALARALRHETVDEEIEIEALDGTRKVVRNCAVPLVGPDGELRGVVVMNDDVTARRHAEAERERARAEAERLAREEGALRAATEAVSAAITVDGVIEAIAHGALRATEADDALVQRIDAARGVAEVAASAGSRSLRPGECVPYRDSLAEHVVEGGEPVVIREMASDLRVPEHLVRACGSCSALAVPMVDDAGEAVGALVLLRDRNRPAFTDGDVRRAATFARLASLAFRKVRLLEESEQRGRELRRLLETRSRLVRGFSHDVKNPLGAADGHLALVVDGLPDALTGRQRESIRSARRSIAAAFRLIDALVELARAEAGQITIRRVAVDVRGVAREVAAEHHATAAAKGLELTVDLPEELPVIRSDPDRIRQILGNLVTNAVKYTEHGGVRVSVVERAGERGSGPVRWICVDVADTGPGIPGDRQEEVFGEFARLEPGKGRGTGLGLTISRSLARLLGGDVTLDSEPPRGSTFTLWLPIRAGAAAGATGDVALDGGSGRRAGVAVGAGPGPRAGTLRDGGPDPPSRSGSSPGGKWSEVLLDRLEDYAVFLVDPDGRILRWNRGAQRTTGHAADQALGRPSSMLHPPEERRSGRPELELRTALARGRYEADRQRVRADGTRFTAHVVLVPVHDDAGRHVGFGVLIHDLSERERTERRLRESERRFRATFEQAAVGIAHLAPDGRWLRVNRRLLEILGYSREELQRMTFQEITHPADVTANVARLRRLLAGEVERYEMETRYIRKDGAIVWGHLTASMVRDEAGRPEYIIGVVEDITPQKETEAALRETDARLRLARDMAGLGDWELDLETLDSPRRSLGHDRIFGYAEPVRDWSYERYLEHVVPEDRAEVDRQFRVAFESGRPWNFECRIRRVDGAVRWIWAKGGIFHDAEGQPDRAFGIIVDITERRRTEEELRRAMETAEEASRAKSEFLAVMSHELRTPLTAVIGYAELLDLGVEGPLTHGQRARVERIKASARHLVDLIEEILSFSRMESGREDVRLERVDLAALARHVAGVAEPDAATVGLRFRVGVPDARVAARTDPAKVRRILLNLLSNAAKFTPHGEVGLRLHVEDGCAVFRVDDTGVGIAAEHLERIFEPFYQVERALTRTVGGTGLGLTVARRLARMLGGDIAVESEPGVGSTFTVRIPRIYPSRRTGRRAGVRSGA